MCFTKGQVEQNELGGGKAWAFQETLLIQHISSVLAPGMNGAMVLMCASPQNSYLKP